MKKITFIRHAPLEKPYNDYTKLSFEKICALATTQVEPNINMGFGKSIVKQLNHIDVKNIDLILCSQSKRTKQTAKLISKLGEKNLEIEISDNLSEIYFNPAILTSKEKFIRHGLTVIRKSLFHGMKKGIGAETLDETLKRAQKLREELIKLPYKNILCITHSFYMRILRLFFLENLTNGHQINELKLMDTIDHKYLEGFNIYL